MAIPHVLNRSRNADPARNSDAAAQHGTASGGTRDRQSALLALSRELRDIVYHSLLNERKRPPEDPHHANDRTPTSQSSPGAIYYETQSPKPALLQLKLCCRQVSAEVQDLLAKHVVSHSGPGQLDIMVRGSSVWPTWIALPLASKLDPIIDIELRIFDTTGLGSEFSTGAYRALWSLFNRMVFRGPCLTHSRNLQRPLIVGRLRFNIVLCFPTSVDDLLGTYRDVFDRLERLAYDNVGLGNVGTIEACLGADRRVWRLKQLPTGLTFASRQVE
ncbi:hypothetical protein CLAFUW4_14221 [Fulvia fulva]|uniref:Uncharacterized protein n=1 Tax=Passalora fulva TaxID=5499 RepID=A0A9Q8PLH0_PASFU|nr:uncharacterized protein CLAFUR5_14054 [Fulvia fulva]KAK4610477.1 hypothetical protein CLAFUR4_14224 [Fulvia fulva]KAK4611170.1 hypothetical protein CLAFUR0_14229 [Fulvia fulva]UJO24577.1 hypothetical protein CLAFUR5_14054 [Fulvia fulva]WPV21704.1 hypothetical protein CLAFUW4_14221 [Fulvia fulva]WPV36937.1 hypothetical protein CLAFUW7_14232 [Fulvia fulva]